MWWFSVSDTTAQTVLFQDPAFLEKAHAAVDSVYNLNAKASRDILDPWRRSEPDHPLWILWDGLELWWKMAPDLQETRYDKEFFHTLGRADYAATRLLARSPNHLDALLVKTLSNGFLARMHANRENWMQSLRFGKAASDALSLIETHYPDIPDTKFGRGLYLYYAEALPETYSFLKTLSWALPSGSKADGLALLREASRESTFLRAEALYFLGNIIRNYEKKPDEAVAYFTELHQKYPSNPFFAQHYLRVSVSVLDPQETIHIAEQIGNSFASDNWPALAEEVHFTKGQILFGENKMELARGELERSRLLSAHLPNRDNRPRQVMTQFYLGEIELAAGNKDRARTHFRSVSRAKMPERYVALARERLRNL